MADPYKADKVMIACVTDEVTIITQAVDYYNIERLHLISFVKEPTDDENKAMAYRAKFYRKVHKAVINELDDDIEVIEHNDSETYLFDKMMESVYSIIEEEQRKGSIIFVNLSSGSKEFCAAAAIASMMHDDIHIFTMGGRSDALTMTKYDKMMDSITHDGKLTGRYYEYHDPYPLNGFRLNTPSINLVKALKVFSMIPLQKRSNTNVIRNLIIQGIWNPSESDDIGDRMMDTTAEYEGLLGKETKYKDPHYKELARKEAVQYQRKYIDKWKSLGWILKDPGTTGFKYKVTDEGLMNIRVFCPDTVFHIDSEDIIYLKKRL